MGIQIMKQLTVNSPIRKYNSEVFSSLLENSNEGYWENQVYAVIWSNSVSFRRITDFGTYGPDDKSQLIGLVILLMQSPTSFGFKPQNAYSLLTAFTARVEGLFRKGLTPNAIAGCLFDDVDNYDDAVNAFRPVSDRWYPKEESSFTVGSAGSMTHSHHTRQKFLPKATSGISDSWMDGFSS